MKKALVIDDSTTMRRLVSNILKEQGGFEIVDAEDGQIALDKLKSGLNVQFICSDYNMPNLDGAGFIRGARAISAYAKTPILVITTNDQARDAVKEAGASGWIKKPFSPDVLLEAVKRLEG